MDNGEHKKATVTRNTMDHDVHHGPWRKQCH